MARVLVRAGEVRDNVEAVSINVEKYVKEIAALVADLTKAAGRMFEQEDLRMINMVSAINPGGSGGQGGNRFTAKGSLERKVIMNLRMVNDDKFLFRQWHRMFITALGQVEGAHEEIIQLLARETDTGRELDKVVENLQSHYGEEFNNVSGDV